MTKSANRILCLNISPEEDKYKCIIGGPTCASTYAHAYAHAQAVLVCKTLTDEELCVSGVRQSLVCGAG